MLSGSYGSAQTYLPLFKIRMSAEFEPEKAQEEQSPKRYLSHEQREFYRVTIRNGIFYQNGEPMHGPYLYALMPDNTLYAAKTTSEIKNHSQITGGEDVRAAGLMYLLGGRLITISNESGHYKPTRAEIIPALEWFAEQIRYYNFIFEDHSAQEHGLLFNGINYSLMVCVQYFHTLLQISLSNLEATTTPLIESANKRYAASLAKEPEYPDNEDMGKDYYISTAEVTPIKCGTFAEKLLRSKFSYFSCLSNFLDDNIKLKSRYLGHFNKRK